VVGAFSFLTLGVDRFPSIDLPITASRSASTGTRRSRRWTSSGRTRSRGARGAAS
jgi:hypothetical protein